MRITGGQHIDLNRCAASISENGLGAVTVAMAGAPHQLQRDLLIDSWSDNNPRLQRQLLSSFANDCHGHEIANQNANTRPA